MRDVIYLVVSERGVQRMTKNIPGVSRGESPIKLTINIPKEAFAPPVLSQEITVNDWRQGIGLDDVEFKQSVITGEEAEIIRQNRLAKMQKILEAQGYGITKPDDK